MIGKRILCGVMSLIILCAGFTCVFRIYQRRNFTCTAQYYSTQKNISMKAIYRLMFSGTEGIISITGEVVDEHKNHLALNRQMVFTFRERNANYLMHSEKGIRESYDEVDNGLLRKMINPFFLEENHTIQYLIQPLSNGNYIVFSGRLPVAWCRSAG